MSALERWNDMDAHGSHDPLIEDVLDAGNDLRDELLAEVERLTKARKRHAKLEREAVLAYGKMSKRAEAAEAKVLQLGIEKDAEEYRANVAEAERDRLAWMLERIRDSEYDRMSDADALADLAVERLQAKLKQASKLASYCESRMK